MFIEYPGCNISAVRLARNDDQEVTWVTGTAHDGSSNKLIVWTSGKCPQVMNGSSTCELKQQSEENFRGDVTRVCPFKGSMVAAASSDGHITVYNLNSYQLDQVCQTNVFPSSCNDVVWSELNHSLIAAGDDGQVSFLELSRLSAKPKSVKISQTPITSLDLVSSNEIICGNSAGHLKVIDMRKGTVVMSLPNTLSSIQVVKRNPSNGHLVVSGNESGNVCLWDLRSEGSILVQFSAHDSLITELQYKENESNIIISSSLDGQLLKWNLLPSCQLQSVDSLVSPQSAAGPSITCFHLNPLGNEIVYGTDNEVLSFTSL